MISMSRSKKEILGSNPCQNPDVSIYPTPGVGTTVSRRLHWSLEKLYHFRNTRVRKIATFSIRTNYISIRGNLR